MPKPTPTTVWKKAATTVAACSRMSMSVLRGWGVAHAYHRALTIFIKF
jgi:hypothetical protein